MVVILLKKWRMGRMPWNSICRGRILRTAGIGGAMIEGCEKDPESKGVCSDTFGNPNTSVVIQLKVMKNGDTTGNEVVNIGDALRLANNVSYPGNPAYILN